MKIDTVGEFKAFLENIDNDTLIAVNIKTDERTLYAELTEAEHDKTANILHINGIGLIPDWNA